MSCIFVGGTFKNVYTYVVSERHLLKTYQISHDHSSGGVSDYPESSEMIAAGVSRSEPQSNADTARLSDGSAGASRPSFQFVGVCYLTLL